ncbi:hypothetical protein OAK03_01610 [Gammaproteobacteria bacterium]|nr:hypothetical protein [Gammaproteobacteria bacterium]
MLTFNQFNQITLFIGLNMKIICIYNASSTWVGELNYLYKKLFENKSCSLCDLSHGMTGIKKEWKEMESISDHEYSLLHINEVPSNIPHHLIKKLPCVLKQDIENFELLIRPEELQICNGSIESFKILLEKKIKPDG